RQRVAEVGGEGRGGAEQDEEQGSQQRFHGALLRPG
ncbi:hypothetical protein PSE305_10940, partial [Pseudomonas aeruginosa]